MNFKVKLNQINRAKPVISKEIVVTREQYGIIEKYGEQQGVVFFNIDVLEETKEPMTFYDLLRWEKFKTAIKRN